MAGREPAGDLQLWRSDASLRWDVLRAHLEAAGFLWTAWNDAVASARHTFPDVAAGPEWRLKANADALVAAGDRAARRLLIPALQEDDPESSPVAALALVRGERPGPVMEAFRAAGDDARGPLARALQVAPLGPPRKQMESLACAVGAPPPSSAAATWPVWRRWMESSPGSSSRWVAATRTSAISPTWWMTPR